MKVVILAGGRGTRIAEETAYRPKPLVEIGGKPILWHIMMHYASFGMSDFVVTLGYKGDLIKAFFEQQMALRGDLVADFRSRRLSRVEGSCSPEDNWMVHLIDTGVDTPTGGRVHHVRQLLGNEPFMLTFGDGVSDVNIEDLLGFHRSHGKLATVTTVRPPGRFGEMEFEGDRVKSFLEKPADGGSWISGGFFVVEPGALEYVGPDDDWSRDCLERLVSDGQLMAYRHNSFWQCMDTLQEKAYLESLWDSQQAPWKSW